MKQEIHFFFLFFFILIFFGGCEMVEFSPNQHFDSNTPKQINQKNIDQILSGIPDDTLRIAFTGDSQRFYDDADDFVHKVNTIPGIDFVIHSGDISDFGLLLEFELIHEIFSRLYVPYVSVIGNHDLVANGEYIYSEMYGPLNFTFIYDSVKFIFHNTNSREFQFNGQVPDLTWLQNECMPQEDVKHIIAVSHVPPNNDDFDKALEAGYAEIFRNCPGLLVSLHGHLHTSTDQYIYNDGVRYINSSSVEKSEFLLLEVFGDNLNVRHVEF